MINFTELKLELKDLYSEEILRIVKIYCELRDIPIEERKRLQEENDALIFKKLKSKQIQIVENGIPILNFTFKDFPNFGIWTKINASFICLEPWVGYSDVLNTTGNILEKEGIQLLESNSSKEFNFNIEIL
jgi:galactose mutarotase-like enzyme